MPDVELRLPSDVQYVGLARLVVTVAARQAGMVEERIEDLRIAVSEAVSNAIRSKRSRGREEPVVLSFGPVGSRHFAVTIADAGSDFEPPVSDPATPDWEAEGSVGVTLIRNLVDDVEVAAEGGTVLRMRFAVSEADGSQTLSS